jgi:4a-hydroxytetrahydrobiopterin dehydratase
MMEKLADLQLNFDKKIPGTQAQVDLMSQLPHWQVVELKGVKQLARIFTFNNFAEAMAFANAVASLAEAENHHPALLVEWGKTSVSWWTHSLGGLHQNDFIMAARCDRLYAMQ